MRAIETRSVPDVGRKSDRKFGRVAPRRLQIGIARAQFQSRKRHALKDAEAVSSVDDTSGVEPRVGDDVEKRASLQIVPWNAFEHAPTTEGSVRSAERRVGKEGVRK